MTGSCYDGTNDFEWIKKNKPLGDNLDVYEIAEVSNSEQRSGKTPLKLLMKHYMVSQDYFLKRK